MRVSVILPIAVLCLCGGLLTVARSGAGPVEASARARTGMEILQAYPCHRAETKVVLVRGKEDNFSPEGLEPNFLRPGRDSVRMRSIIGSGSYDQSQVDRPFTDSFLAPARMAKGLFIISLRPVGTNENDPIAIGDMESPFATKRFSEYIRDLGKSDGWVVEGPLHYAELSQLRPNTPDPDDPTRTLQDDFGARPDPIWLDVWIQDDTSVDFMGLAACVAPPKGKGLSLAARPAAASQDAGFVALSCNEGERDKPICDPISGDTSCAAALPVACLRPGDAPVPRGLKGAWELWSWSGGEIAFTEPIAAERFASIGDVDRFCARSLGSDWRTASFHDGGRNGIVAGRGDPTRLPFRAWVDIADQPYATCWAR